MDQIKIIARETRRVCENFAARSKRYDFSKCRDLTGMCASASLILKEVYSFYGYCVEFWEKNTECCGHCWVKIGDLNIDITASQFEGPKVYIGKKAFQIKGWGKFHKIKHKEKISETLYRLGWPKSQLLDQKVIDKLKNRVINKVEKISKNEFSDSTKNNSSRSASKC
jgi:hypothetical protein